ncbi:hypothetical protein ACEZDB_26930 [Streptacidiphilus sp. N1-3]|uniref:Uncharacterized protein n=1 Tax=Streptacidiphilus alkalitolerans TaxID=3342712 RepID=A0ABV6X8T2_9ACTN
MEEITLISLCNFWDEYGYGRSGRAYSTVNRRIREGEYPVYVRSPHVRFIEPDVAKRILKEVPPLVAEEVYQEEIESVSKLNGHSDQPELLAALQEVVNRFAPS